jgi:hemolysin activation/secretion protein
VPLSKSHFLKKIFTAVLWRGGDVIFGVVFLGISCVNLVAAGGPHALAYSYSEDAPPPVPPVAATPPGVSTNAVDRSQMLYIKEFRVIGSHQLSRSEIEKSVYPFMGPERTPEDVEQARAALEKAFQDKGFQTVNVQIPQQTGKRGIVFLEVTEAKIGRLTVEGSRFFSLKAIKKGVPSLQPGNVPNFNKVSSEILALNQWSDRQVIPTLTPGFEPGTVDVNLKVKDTLPLHGSTELNNRWNTGSPALRLNFAGSYDNLWQLGHSIGGSYQTAPQKPSAVQNWNLFYTSRFPRVDWLRLNVSYGKQNSLSTLGGGSVAGNGSTAAFRFLFNLPPEKDFSHSISAGMDFKQVLNVNNDATTGANVPLNDYNYAPVRFNYSAVWAPKDYVTILDAGFSFGIRGQTIPVYGLGSYNDGQFDDPTVGGGFFTTRGDLSHTHDLPGGFQIYGKVQGQWSPTPLIFTEQFVAGGLDSCRGYTEATVLGDSALMGSVELRSPQILAGHLGVSEWRVYAFFDGGTVLDGTPGSQYSNDEDIFSSDTQYNLASYGFGTRCKIAKYLNASIDAGFPLITQSPVLPPTPSAGAWGKTVGNTVNGTPGNYFNMANSMLITFRLFGEF